MKKALVVLGVLAALLVMAFVVVAMVARNAERKTQAALARLVRSTDAGSQVLDKNDLALELESLADPLGIELRPRDRRVRTAATEIPRALTKAMNEWLRVQEETPTDAITPLPAEVVTWLETHREHIDGITDRIVAGGIPRWPVNTIGAPSNHPVPNLLGHMQLFRVLSTASLDREMRGDHAGAWKLQQAAWHLAQGLLDRSETITTLIAIAGLRLQASTQRKLEAPVPSWVSDVARVRLQEQAVDALRRELGNTARFARGGSYLSEMLATTRHEPSKSALVGEAIMSPVVRWSIAESVTAAVGELDALREADPCAASQVQLDLRVRQQQGPVAQRMGAFVIPSLSNAITRAAVADIAIEGTSKVLAAKSARAVSGEWPASIPSIERSRCADARWIYAVDPSGDMSLRFEGDLRQPEGFRGSKIPLEYRGLR